MNSPTAPQVGVRAEHNSETGSIEVNGGELFLPHPGLGISYEKDSETGETKTFLNLKRNF